MIKHLTLKLSLILLFGLVASKPVFAIDYSLIGKPAPQFELQEISSDSKKIKLSDYKGKLVLINFWASWCGPCRAEIPTLVKLQEKYQDRNFTILGLAVEDEPFVKKFLETNAFDINFPMTSGKAETNKILEQYGNPDGMLPFSVLISPKQNIISIYPGIIGETKMNRVLGRFLDDF